MVMIEHQTRNMKVEAKCCHNIPMNSLTDWCGSAPTTATVPNHHSHQMADWESAGWKYGKVLKVEHFVNTEIQTTERRQLQTADSMRMQSVLPSHQEHHWATPRPVNCTDRRSLQASPKNRHSYHHLPLCHTPQ